ncbi:MAG: tetratricopeptide repeat protein [Deltaproteobacteria bacterium]|nr:MAG: tetratricopeptide repeat protein [Deltaproteobacteria bacterium]
MRRLILFFSLLTLSLGCASSGPSFLSHAFEDDIQESRKLIEAGNFKQAADDLSVFLEMAPKNDEARFLRALAYQNLEQFPAAIKDYETIIKNIRKNNQKTLSDHTAKSHYNLGMIFAFKLNEPHQALEHFDDYLSLSQASHDSNERDYQVAKIMCSLDHSDSSEKNEDLPTLMIEVGKIQNTLEKRKRLEEILKTHPNSPVASYVLGQTFESEGKWDEAISTYQNVLKSHPTCGICHEALGNLLLKKKKTMAEGQNHKKKAQLFMSSK